MLLFLFAAPPFEDRRFPSRVFGQDRNFRLFLPDGYSDSTSRFPVIYYFHGHSDRYTLERYDDGKDTVPKIARFVAENPVIVVAVDGYIPEHYTGFYGGTPYDVYSDGGGYDFGESFRELIAHIDSSLRTLPGRRYRATSGLSMGSYMSLYLSARYPDLVGSASAFNPGPEFYAGEKGRRVLWRPKDHVPNHTRTMVRLIRASGDYISQYHEETRLAYARNHHVDFEFRQDEYHRHWATSIAETFAFHLRAFSNPALDNTPELFHHDNAHAQFSVWGWDVATQGGGAGYTVLRNVSQSGLRIQTRRWAPDGPPVPGRTITITTPPLYKAGATYSLIDAPLNGGEPRRLNLTATAAGRLRFEVDGSGRQVSINGPGAGAQPPVLFPVSRGDCLRVLPGVETALPIRVYNPRAEPVEDVRVELETEYPTVALATTRATIPRIASGALVDLSNRFKARFTATDGDFAPARITVKLSSGMAASTETIDLLIAPDGMTAPLASEILDGRTATFKVFRQKGNQGGGSSLDRTVTEGKGNGNGVLEPGEEATLWVKLAQGLDPFDKNNWYRARVYTDSPWLEEVERLEEQKQREWTGAKELTSVVRLSLQTPPGTMIPLVLSNESWSFHFTPDVRYGTEPLYQAFQLHRSHVHRMDLKVPPKSPAVEGAVLSNDAWPRATSLAEWTADVIRISKLETATETAQAKAFFEWLRLFSRMAVGGMIQAFEGPYGKETPVLDAHKQLFVYGWGFCDTTSRIAEAAWQSYKRDPRAAERVCVQHDDGGYHTMFRLRLDGRYAAFDPRYGYYLIDRDAAGARILDWAELNGKFEINRAYKHRARPFFEVGGKEWERALLLHPAYYESENAWRAAGAPKEHVFGDGKYKMGTVYHDMTFSLKPGMTIDRHWDNSARKFYVPAGTHTRREWPFLPSGRFYRVTETSHQANWPNYDPNYQRARPYLATVPTDEGYPPEVAGGRTIGQAYGIINYKPDPSSLPFTNGEEVIDIRSPFVLVDGALSMTGDVSSVEIRTLAPKTKDASGPDRWSDWQQLASRSIELGRPRFNGSDVSIHGIYRFQLRIKSPSKPEALSLKLYFENGIMSIPPLFSGRNTLRFRLADASALFAPVTVLYNYDTAAGAKTARHTLRREDFQNGEAVFTLDAPGLTRCRSLSISY
jgi:pimeloyl-ACP methyl ester carboxylesterase